MTRKEILDTAAKCVCGDREQDYGSPENNFQTIAKMWDAYLKGGKKTAIDAVDVAAMLAMLKIARIASGHAKEDNWVDLAGYAACGGEIQSNANRSESPKPKAETLNETDTPVRYSPCIVWVYDDDTWDWDLQPSFKSGDYKKRIVATHTDCTVEIITTPGGLKSGGWWRNDAPPVDLSNIWMTDDDDCN